MKKLIILVTMLVCLFSASMTHAFELGGIKGKASVSLLTGNEQGYEDRINPKLNAQYKDLFFNGDYKFDYNTEGTYVKHQYKSLVGITVVDGFSARYQYEDFESDKFIPIAAKVKNGKLIPAWTKELTIKNTDNRYGVGYNRTDKIGIFKVTNDFMVLAESNSLMRGEYTFGIDTKWVSLRNQWYMDFDSSYTYQKYYEQATLSYKATENIAIVVQCNKMTDKDYIYRAGLTFSY